MTIPEKRYTVMVYTADTLADCVANGGVGWWKIGIRSVNQIAYAIVANKGGHADKTINFIIKVTGHRRHPDPEVNRVQLTFNEFAVLETPTEVWRAQRNPVAYVNPKDFGIDLEALTWAKVADIPVPSKTAAPFSFDQLTIQDIKNELARRFQVEPTAIEINVKH